MSRADDAAEARAVVRAFLLCGGREIRLAVTVWDDGRQAARLHGLMREVEAAVEGIAVVLDNWRVVGLQFLRSRVVRDADGPWAGMVEYRVRVLEG